MSYSILRNHFLKTVDHFEEFELYYINGYQLAEIALMFSANPRTIQRRILQTKAVLHEILNHMFE